MMKLFANPERALGKKLERALAAADEGEFDKAAYLCEQVASDAAALRGPDDPALPFFLKASRVHPHGRTRLPDSARSGTRARL